MRDNKKEMIRRSILFIAAALLCLSQESDWKKVDAPPGVDFSGLSQPQKTAVLAVIRTEPCSCGCSMKVAECRIKDPSCAYSRRLAAFAIRDAAAGKAEAAIRTDLDKYAKEPPPVLEPPVKLNIAGAPFKGPENAPRSPSSSSPIFSAPTAPKRPGEAAQVVQKFPKDVKLVFKQFPLDDHAQAGLAAEASLVAQAQGKFWQLHDKMYANFRSINRERILVWATEVGLDMNRFRAELDSPKYKARVHAEEQEGEVVGVEGTPQFYINGKKFNAVLELRAKATNNADELNKNEITEQNRACRCQSTSCVMPSIRSANSPKLPDSLSSPSFAWGSGSASMRRSSAFWIRCSCALCRWPRRTAWWSSAADSARNSPIPTFAIFATAPARSQGWPLPFPPNRASTSMASRTPPAPKPSRPIIPPSSEFARSSAVGFKPRTKTPASSATAPGSSSSPPTRMSSANEYARKPSGTRSSASRPRSSKEFICRSAWICGCLLRRWTRQHPGFDARMEDRGQPMVLIFGRLKPGVAPGQASAEINSIAAQLPRTETKTPSIVLEQVRGIPSANTRRRAAPVAALLMVVVGVILLIACVNVGNLLIARGASRHREISVRIALGARRRRLLACQLLTESLLLAIFGGIAGIFLGLWSNRLLELLLAAGPYESVQLDLAADTRVLLFTALLSLATTLFFGLAPAWRASRVDVLGGLKGPPHPAPASACAAFRWSRRFRFRSSCCSLPASSFASSANFIPPTPASPSKIAGTSIPTSPLPNLLPNPAAPSMPRPPAAFVLSRREKREPSPAIFRSPLSRKPARRLPNMTRFRPLPASSVPTFSKPCARPYWPVATFAPPSRSLSPSSMMRWPSASGPAKTPSGNTSSSAAVRKPTPKLWVSPATSASSPWASPPSPTPTCPSPAPTPVTKPSSLKWSPASPCRPEQIRKTIAAARNSAARVYAVSTLADWVDGSFWQILWEVSVLSAFAALALLLSAVGLYGMISYHVTLRRREIGVRMAIGARPGDVFRLVLRQSMTSTLVGIAIGLVLAAAIARLMAKLLYGVRSHPTL